MTTNLCFPDENLIQPKLITIAFPLRSALIAARYEKERGNEGKMTPGDVWQCILFLFRGSEEKRDSSAYLHLSPLVIGQSSPCGKDVQKQQSLPLPSQNCTHFFVLMQTVHLMCREDPTQEERIQPKFFSSILRSSLVPLLPPPHWQHIHVDRRYRWVGLGTRWSCPLKLIQ